MNVRKALGKIIYVQNLLSNMRRRKTLNGLRLPFSFAKRTRSNTRELIFINVLDKQRSIIHIQNIVHSLKFDFLCTDKMHTAILKSIYNRYHTDIVRYISFRQLSTKTFVFDSCILRKSFTFHNIKYTLLHMDD